LINYIRTKEEKELIQASEDVKIRDLSKGDAERLIEVVGKWGFYMGTTNRLSSEDIIAICKFLKDSYDYLTVSEISLVLNLNIKGDLGNIEFFGIISPRYMSQVINAYLEYKRENLRDLLDRKYLDEVSKKSIPTKEENHKILCDIIREEYANYKKTQVVNDFFSIVYDYIVKKGYVDFDDNGFEESAKKYAEYQLTINSLKKATTMGDLLRSAYNKNQDSALQRYMQNYAVIYLFSKIKDIDEFINGINVDEVE